MNKTLGILVILAISTPASTLLAQVKFRDGIFANIDMVRTNSPIPATWIETDMEAGDRKFYKNITRSNEIIFYDDNGVRSVLDTRSIWGYSYRGDLHINVGGAFHKIDFVGRLSHFVASKTTYKEILMPGDIMYFPPVLVTTKNQEYIVDIVENKVWAFNQEGMKLALKNDPQLLDEFMSLTNREQNNSMYIFLTRYNEKYPLEFSGY